MAIDKVWVLAEAGESGPDADHAGAADRGPGSGAAPWRRWPGGRTRRRSAATLGEYGATTVHDVGDLGGALPGVAGGGGHRRSWPTAGGPDAMLVPATYDGRDVAGRLSAKLDRPVLTNVTGLVAGDGLRHPAPGVRGLAHRHGPVHRRRAPASS